MDTVVGENAVTNDISAVDVSSRCILLQVDNFIALSIGLDLRIAVVVG